MRILFTLLCLMICLSSCKSTKRDKIVTKKDYPEAETVNNKTSSKAEKIVTYAKTFEGVRYEFGGTTKRGMDCSGLVFTAFKHQNVLLPRISRDMAKRGKRINLNEVTEGDLLFFKTNKRQAKINHVGLVVSTNKKSIEFIHSTTSKGVITSLLSENYWNKAFIEARRVL